jgi:endonuclease/exonuclease/phosphatase family metal-dependent hydrolase
MTYNIQHMNKMFENNAIKPSQQRRAQKIAKVIQDIQPHVLGIVEAANAPEEHQHFIENYLSGSGYRLASGVSRGGQNLVFYYREPFSVERVDEDLSFYDPWEEDIDEDGLKERHRWERKPLEVVFKIGANGLRLRTILVHAKSKVVFSVVDLYDFQKISAANRKRLMGQALKLRRRLDALLRDPNRIPLIVMGDLNDGPGMDPFERMLGRSFVETIMGTVWEPAAVLHNTLWWMSTDRRLKKELWTADFTDHIVNNPRGGRHRVWIDHLLVSPDMLQPDSQVRYVENSGSIGPKTGDARAASDHFPVFARIAAD